MSRAMTSAEKQRFRGYFPRLDVNRARVTGNATRTYNCISWTVGVTNRWLWPGSSLSNFDAFYRRFGFRRTGNGPVAAWGHSASRMTHGCISGRGHGPRWESKCGSDLRIQHGLNELVGASYGRVVAFYSRSRFALSESENNLINAILNTEFEVMILNDEQAKILQAIVGEINAQTRKDFEELFSEWKKSWNKDEYSFLSDPAFVRNGDAYYKLAALGEEIIPLLVEKLTDPENFLALQLYDSIQDNNILRVDNDPEDDLIFEGEQGRAQRTVENFLNNY